MGLDGPLLPSLVIFIRERKRPFMIETKDISTADFMVLVIRESLGICNKHSSCYIYQQIARVFRYWLRDTSC